MHLGHRLGSLAGIVLMAAALTTSCGEEGPVGEGGGPLGDIATQCGLTCATEGVLQGNASISGIRSVDAFFQSVVTFQGEAAALKASVDEVKGKIAASVGLSPGATGAELEAAIRAKLDANVQGGLDINFAPPECAASADVAIEASARCDADIDPGMVQVMCMGTCEVQASATATCDASAQVVCTGTAPALRCSGSCQGECTFAANATCEGKCMGGCMGACTVNANGMCSGTCNGKCDGTCMGDTDSGAGCSGTCMGNCEGSCQIDGSVMCGGSCDAQCTGECMADVGGQCSGSCEGECEYTPPSAMCSAGASVTCKAEVMAGAMCSGKCDGEVQPPSAKAECQASAKAEAEAKVECTPPRLDVNYQFAASVAGNATAEAEFRAWLEGFKANLSVLLSLRAKANAVVNAGASLAGAAEGAVTGALTALQGDANLKTKIGAGCAVTALGDVGTAIDGATANLMGSVDVAASVFAAVGLT